MTIERLISTLQDMVQRKVARLTDDVVVCRDKRSEGCTTVYDVDAVRQTLDGPSLDIKYRRTR